MRNPTLIAAAFLILSVVPARPAGLGTDAIWNGCIGPQAAKASADDLIAACTAAIRGGAQEPEWLALAYSNRGVGWRAKGDLDQAIDNFTAVIRLAPEYAKGYQQRGSAYFAKDDRVDGLRDLGEAIHLNPLDAESFAIRGNAYRVHDDNDLALADYAKALKRDPHNLAALTGRGFVWLAKNEPDKAIADLDAAEMIRPNSRDVFVARAGAYDQKGELDRALADYDRALAVPPNDPEVLDRTCWARARRGVGLDQALADCDRAVALAAGNGAVLDSRALVLLRLGRPREAIADENAALAAKGADPHLFFVRGVAKLRSGDEAGGQSDLAAARALEPRIAEIYAGWGIAPPP